MDLTLSEQDQAFQAELRTWLAANGPGPEPAGDDARFEWRRRWQEQLASGGWSGVHWPSAYGGRGATVTQSALFFEEIAQAGAPLPANVLGLLLAGPTIMQWGTAEQKDRLLAPILTADEIWCQGFSEPEAGSDLAALRCRAVRHGDGWRITGQKVWTSYARHSKWCMLLARTDPDAPRHKGLTYFLLDMDQPEIQVRPLKQLTGEAHFNELFLDGARVDDPFVLGGVGVGWKVAMTTLSNERAGIAFFHQVRARQMLEAIVAEAHARGLLDDARVAERLAALYSRIETLRLTAYRALTTMEKYGQPGPESALTKVMWSGTNQELTQCAVDVLGPGALLTGSRWSYELLRARGNTIEGGTTEILKNVLAERALGLPRSR
jgi:alkylation response protein AidB-like acyl-CoA dehydrogenase